MDLPTFDTLFSKEMNRKEFLLHIGVVLLTLFGISGILRTLSNPHILSSSKQHLSTFGSGTYGGIKKV
ncbi:MAG: hypothetical protein H6772_02525 [Pseudomonadales bacterium]|nr:hypothetical protein [Pseudomonadales bacterium]